MQHLDPDRLVDLGAGWEQPNDAETAHLAECPACGAELAEIRRTVSRAREASRTGSVRLEDPPQQVWQRILSEVEPAEESHEDNVRELPPPARRYGRRRIAALMTAAAAAGAIAGSALTAVSTDDTRATTETTVVASTKLGDPGAGEGTGTARLVSREGQRVLIVRIEEVAVQGAYLKVWLRNPAGTEMYALGTFPEHSPGRYAVPDGISLDRFSVVDISVQQYNGDPGHSKTSILRGSLNPR